MSDTIHAKVQAQFAPQAAKYAASKGHADPAVLGRLMEFAEPKPDDVALDIATGGGHVALTLAPMVRRVVALDLTPAMLEQVRRQAEERGLGNVETVEAAAEALPFEDESFSFVAVRLAPHHFADVPGFLREVARVLQPEGRFFLVDTTVPEDEALDGEINRIELLRDPSHVRNYRPSEWRTMLEATGFTVTEEEVGMFADGFRMEFTDWVGRIGTPGENVPVLKEAFSHASDALREALQIRQEAEALTFELPELRLMARKVSLYGT